MTARKNPTRSKPRSRQRRLAFETLESRQLLSVATFNPVADTYVGGGVSGAGSASVLDVRDFGNGGGDRWAYVRFDLSGYTIDAVNSATLTFYKQDGSRSDTIVAGRFEVYGLREVTGNTAQSWSEATLDTGSVGSEYSGTADSINFSRLFNLDEDAGANVLEAVNNGIGLPQSITGPDLVTFLEGRIADDGLVTFITLVDSGSNDRGWGYGSRENSDPDVRPELTLDFEGEEIPDPYPENPVRFTRQVEDLNRGVIAVRDGSDVYVGWRMLGTDPSDIEFNVYRSTDGGAAVKLNGSPLTTTTDFVDTSGLNFTLSHEYFVRPVIGGIEQDPSESFTLAAFSPSQQYISIDLQPPPGGTTPDDVTYNYSTGPGADGEANDTSVGDLDGDGDYEFIVKWNPGNAKDNSQSGYTGNTYIDAYRLDENLNTELMWRIDLGINIRSGAHYSPFIVYDFDGDGKAEIAMRTAPGTIDGQENPVLLGGDQVTDDYRNSSGYILTGPEYLTIFNGETGAEMATIPFEPARGSVTQWGDSYGNRVDRFNAGVAYLDGERPSLVFSRGYYGPQSSGGQARNELVAYDYRGGQLTQRWYFQAGYNINGNINVEYIGQGNHNISVADVDGDGYDEFIRGASVIDDDGTGLYSTGLGHGDALHVSDMDPTNPGLEVFQPHEDPGSYLGAGGEFRDAMTGQLLFGIPSTNDVGRGAAFDIDPNYLGYEMWATTNVGTRSVYNSQGQAIYGTNNISFNFGVWWDADPLRELLDHTTISKWQYNAGTPFAQSIFSPSGVSSNNGTKATPALSADLFGDWREEVVFRTDDSSELRIYTTTIPSTMRLFTLMHDTQYREAIAWQNSAYNQPPHPSFYLGDGMTIPPQPDVYVATPGTPIPGDFDLDHDVDKDDLTIWEQTYGTTPSGGFFGDADDDGDADGSDFLIWQQNVGKSSTPLAAVQTVSEPASLAGAPEDESKLATRDEALASLATEGLPGSATSDTADSAEIVSRPIASNVVEEKVTLSAPTLRARSQVDKGESAVSTAAHRRVEHFQWRLASDVFSKWDTLDRYGL